MDYYLNSDHTYNRLLEEYKKYNSLVVAYDFDNTIYDYHKKGWQFNDVIQLLKQLKAKGCYLIVFTANEDLDFVQTYCNDMSIPFDGINENPPFYNSNSKKIYYNILLDDRAGLKESYNVLQKLIKNI